MKISFDPAKDERNRKERGFSLEVGVEVIRHQVTTRLDDRHDYGEDRLVSFGYVGERLFVCVYTVRGDTLRIISVRKANDREIMRYG
jgi:uncharacterized DUF497 family protein